MPAPSLDPKTISDTVEALVANNFNGLAAAKDLGLSGHTSMIHRRAAHPEIDQRAREIVQTRYREADISARRVLVELARVAFASAKDLYDADGNLIPIHLLSDDAAASIAGVEVEVRQRREGNVTTTKIRRVEKMAALSILSKHLKIVGDEADGVNAIASALAGRLKAARQRAEIVEEVPRELPAPLPQESDDDPLY